MADQDKRPVCESDPAGDVEWYVPAVDICETDDKLVLLLDMPGVANPELNIDGNDLTIEARTEYAEPDDATLIAGEFGPRNFRRSFSLPAGIDSAGITAAAKAGVLRVELPKSAEAKVHKINVKSE